MSSFVFEAFIWYNAPMDPEESLKNPLWSLASKISWPQYVVCLLGFPVNCFRTYRKEIHSIPKRSNFPFTVNQQNKIRWVSMWNLVSVSQGNSGVRSVTLHLISRPLCEGWRVVQSFTGVLMRLKWKDAFSLSTLYSFCTRWVTCLQSLSVHL